MLKNLKEKGNSDDNILKLFKYKYMRIGFWSWGMKGCIEQDFKNAKPLQKELIKTLLIKSMDFCPSTEVVPDWKWFSPHGTLFEVSCCHNWGEGGLLEYSR